MAGRGKMLGSISVKQWMMTKSRTDIQFPVSQIAQFLKKSLQYPVGIGTLIYLASILECLSAEVLELAGNATRDNKKSKIVPQRMQVAVRNDEELVRLLGRVIIDKRCDAQNS